MTVLAAAATSVLTSVSVTVGIAGALVAAFMSVSEYRLKARAQRAQLDAQRAQLEAQRAQLDAQRARSDVDLARLFAELVPVANGRGPSVLSDEVVKNLLDKGDTPSAKELGDRAMVWNPIGPPTQAAAIMSLAVLGREYPNLRESAKAALETMAVFMKDDAKVIEVWRYAKEMVA